jgi:hypothetical protein
VIGLATTPLDLAERCYTERAGTGTCMVCGCHPQRHSVVDGACPHTADSLTEPQIEQWWRTGGHGGSFVDAINASPEIRSAVNEGRVGGPLFAPTVQEIEVSRTRIADALNTLAR